MELPGADFELLRQIEAALLKAGISRPRR